MADYTFPQSWGAFKSATCTLSCNEDITTWLYAWSLHFENGTIPVIVRQEATTATIDESLYDTDTNSSYNSGVYNPTSKQWMNSVAQDKKHMLAWYNGSSGLINALDRTTAALWDWNNGNITVYTSDFSFTTTSEKLIVKKNGADFAEFLFYAEPQPEPDPDPEPEPQPEPEEIPLVNYSIQHELENEERVQKKYEIGLVQVANQSLTCTLSDGVDNFIVDIRLRTLYSGALCADIAVNGVVERLSVLCHNLNPLLATNVLGGNLYFEDAFGNDDPSYTQFNDRFKLIYDTGYKVD